jgi:DNA-directed RNA polymerase specialized sigma24 family protein
MSHEQLLVEWRRWILSTAHEALRSVSYEAASKRDNVQEVAQEGSIALWREYRRLEGRPEPDRTHMALYSAKLRMRAVARGGRHGRLTGHVTSRGSVAVKPLVILDAPAGENGRTIADQVLPPVEDAFDEILLAYHYGDIHKAMASLRPDFRDYVTMRFWHGMSDGEIADKTGVARTTLNNRWKRTIEPGLRKALDHLREAS